MSNNKIQLIITIIGVISFGFFMDTESMANPAANRLTPGEKLTYELRWENIPAGEMQLEIHPITSIDGTRAFHFVLTARTNSVVDIFFKIRDRIDAYADADMTHSIFYRKGQSGERKKDEMIEFDWQDGRAQYSESKQKHAPIELMPGSFDPLSAFYFTRMVISENNPTVNQPVTDGKKNFIGNAELVRRETITLKNGQTYDTYCLKPDVGLFGGVFKDSEDPQLFVWITADERRIPVQIRSKVKVGRFFGELTSAEGI